MKESPNRAKVKRIGSCGIRSFFSFADAYYYIWSVYKLLANCSQVYYNSFVMNKLVEKLIEVGCKITNPRLAVLKYLSVHHSPISARDLHKKIKAFDRASVYRTLNLFEELHLLNVEVIEKEKLYCFAEEPHHHIICKKCGYTEKTKCNHDFGTFKNFNDVYHQLTLTGVCNNCSK